MMKSFPQRQAYRESISNVIRRDLISGKFKCDEPMREQKLATRFGTSRGPVRDALMQLTQEGVLVYQPNKGVRVSSLLTDEERDVVVAMRLELEKYCMSKFVPTASQDDLDNISFLLERLKDACEVASLPEVAENDLALHRYWVAQASPHLESTWIGLSVRMIMKYSRLDNYEQSITEHTRIVEAILNRDVEKAVYFLGENIL
ncbi:MAG: GntR family transcriptional regulator [Opitutales bacterium]|jgi:DNA-binding GntR family transcriptional regulator|nr:GntR family transcriptional regulator [Opitutae bacterium]NBU87103.1 GntR family transcriptional regulator [Verrucomicrobiota bacterium]